MNLFIVLVALLKLIPLFVVKQSNLLATILVNMCCPVDTNAL